MESNKTLIVIAKRLVVVLIVAIAVLILVVILKASIGHDAAPATDSQGIVEPDQPDPPVVDEDDEQDDADQLDQEADDEADDEDDADQPDPPVDDEDDDQDDPEPIDDQGENIVEDDGPTKVMYVVIPHPDDEFQAWSLIENTPDVHKVFMVLVRGEQASYCNSPAYEAQHGAKPPNPWPDGRWSLTCEQARINSFLGFMQDMGVTDDGLPEIYDSLGTRGPFDSGFGVACRKDSLDNSLGECIVDPTALVWSSTQATIIWFNLGDGDLTAEEAEWAISTVLANKDRFGIDGQLADAGIVGASYWNGPGHLACSGYMHPDHGAIQAALRGSDFGVGRQMAPICGVDSEAVVEASVSRDSYFRAFGKPPDHPLGVFFANYGWLSDATEHGHPDNYHDQSTTFHRNQTFWIRQ